MAATIMKSVNFSNRPIDLAGNLFLPEGLDGNSSGNSDASAEQKYPAIITIHPGGGVKEQTSGLYAEKFAELGYVTLAYDASFQGESGGEPHFLEDPAARVRDISAAVDYLQSLDFLDPERIGVWGICAGGGYGAAATMVDQRIKALGTVSALNIGTAWRQGWFGTEAPSAAEAGSAAAHRRKRAGRRDC